VSRLDSFIRRLEAQRACLNLAANLVRELEGEVLELGLGNGRTYDHLRELFPNRAIYVCERSVAAHPDCMPPPELLLLGDMRETLPGARAWLAGRVALAHLDMGTGDLLSSKALADELAPLITPLLRLDGVLVSEPALALGELSPLRLPDEVEPRRYHLYRRVSLRSPPSPGHGRTLSSNCGSPDKHGFPRVHR
jgi:S-adenosyl-L-methionine methyltransferase